MSKAFSEVRVSVAAGRLVAAALALIAALPCASCVESLLPATQVELVIDADQGVRTSARQLEIDVRASAGVITGPEDLSMVQVQTDDAEFPFRITLVPQDNQAGHRFWVQVRAFADNNQQQPISEARLLSGYVQGKLVEMRLMLYSNCGQNCDWNASCNGEGGCDSAEVEDPESLTVSDPDDYIARAQQGEDPGAAEAGDPVCETGASQGCSCTSGGETQAGSQECFEDQSGWNICDCSDQEGPVCTPGASRSCECVDGEMGEEFCTSEGDAWEPCACDMSSVLDAGMLADAGAPPADPPDTMDCFGVSGGDAVEDTCGVCDGPGPSTYYADVDGDGLGDPEATMASCETQLEGYVATATDPDDGCADGVPDACDVCRGDNSSCAGCDGFPGSGRTHECSVIGDSCIDDTTLQNCEIETSGCRTALPEDCLYGCTDGACCEGPEQLCASGVGSVACGATFNACGNGVDCGSCGGGGVCIQNTCCTPQCTDSECGDDGCGGSCGSCDGSEFCSDESQCVVGSNVPSCVGAALDCSDDGDEVSCCDVKRVTGGVFPMGRCGNATQYDANSCSDGFDGEADEMPEHDVTVSDFELDTFPVTVGRFRKFVAGYKTGWRPAVGDGANVLVERANALSAGSTGWQSSWDSELPDDADALKNSLLCNPSYQTWTDSAADGEQHPLNCASWYAAFAFCAWDGGRLPTEAEWEYATAGGDDNRLYPWGVDSPVGRANHSSSGGSPRIDVGTYPAGAGRWGQHDLVGGLWEWTLDAYSADYYSAVGNSCVNCANTAGMYRTYRGSSFGSGSNNLYATSRAYAAPWSEAFLNGLRCARDIVCNRDDCGVCDGPGRTTYYKDSDGDLLGDPASAIDLCPGQSTGGYVLDNTDSYPDCSTNDTDSCGVCAGTNECVDCAGVPNGTAVADGCGVCEGSGSTTYYKDSDGDLLGDAASPRDFCPGEDTGGYVLDSSDSEPDCSTNDTDSCGVCAGSNGCVDCLGVPNGSAVADVCGVCQGDGSTCGEAFVSVWRTTTDGESVTLPLRSGFGYDFQVDWGDGSSLSAVSSHDDPDRVHVYASAGDYTVQIAGLLETIYFNDEGDKDKIISIPELGDVGWTSFSNAFQGCTNLVDVAGGNTAGVTDMGGMFRDAENVEPAVAGWDTSRVTDMSYLFAGTANADPDVSSWDTSQVVSMNHMFYYAEGASPDVSSWDTSRVTNMATIFYSASQADPDVSGWDTSRVTNMAFVFCGALNARPDVSGWDTSKVTNMRAIFAGARRAEPDMSSWDFSLVNEMNDMLFNNDIGIELYSKLLLQLEATNQNSGVTLGGGSARYHGAAGVARQSLIDEHGWTITDGGPCDPASGGYCVQDCAGEWGGSAVEDACGVCGGDSSTCGPLSCLGAGLDCDDNGTAVSCCDSQLVSGGTFAMGRCGAASEFNTSSCSDGYDGSEYELPEHDVSLASFELDTFEVTVGRFRKFVEAYESGWRPQQGTGMHPLIAESGWQSGWDSSLPSDAAALKSTLKCESSYQTWTDTAGAGEQHPINCVSWYEAFAFCAWDGGRLATEAEWEFGAAGGSENRLCPWGSDSSVGRANHSGSGNDSDIDVGSYPTGVSRYGQHDLAGSMSEWTLDWYDGNYYSGAGATCANCAKLSSGSARVRRGGFFRNDINFLRAASRAGNAPTTHSYFIGLRCARDN